MKKFETVAKEFTDWANLAFPASNSNACLVHLESEIMEVRYAGSPEHRKEEYADCMGCLLHAISKDGFTLQDITEYLALKLEVNKARKWKLNPDNTYSHIKEAK